MMKYKRRNLPWLMFNMCTCTCIAWFSCSTDIPISASQILYNNNNNSCKIQVLCIYAMLLLRIYIINHLYAICMFFFVFSFLSFFVGCHNGFHFYFDAEVFLYFQQIIFLLICSVLKNSDILSLPSFLFPRRNGFVMHRIWLALMASISSFVCAWCIILIIILVTIFSVFVSVCTV